MLHKMEVKMTLSSHTRAHRQARTHMHVYTQETTPCELYMVHILGALSKLLEGNGWTSIQQCVIGYERR